MVRAAIFDLDGTLLDTLGDLSDSANLALSEFGMPLRSEAEVRDMVGNGVRKLMERLLGDRSELVAPCMARFKALYAQRLTVRTRAYPGVVPMLQALRARGVKLAVVSNKFDDAVKALCDAMLPGLLDAALGEREGIPRKPAPDGCLEAMRRLGVRAEDCAYVGDADTDVKTAHNAGLVCVGVSWGFRGRAHLMEAGADEIVDTAEALLDLLLGDRCLRGDGGGLPVVEAGARASEPDAHSDAAADGLPRGRVHHQGQPEIGDEQRLRSDVRGHRRPVRDGHG